MADVKPRICVTLIWFGAFVLCVTMVISFGFAHDAEGIRFATPSEAIELIPDLCKLYVGHIGVVLAFWFLRPLPALSKKRWDRFRIYLAVVCTLMLNVFVLFNLSRGYWQTSTVSSLSDLVEQTFRISLSLSFIVAPSNAFLFGTKQP